jgi:hypothetical protein
MPGSDSGREKRDRRAAEHDERVGLASSSDLRYPNIEVRLYPRNIVIS